MAWIAIESYELNYQSKRDYCHVNIKFREGDSPDGELLTESFRVEPSTAIYLADMLRNEKPVYFDPETGAIETGKEEVGEEEA